MPILFRVQVPLSHKLILMTLFSLGFFVIIATVLRAHYSLVSISTLPVALGWASRETFVATLVACAPGIKPLVSRVRWFKDSSGGEEKCSRDMSGQHLESGGSFVKRSQNPRPEDDNKIMIERSVDVYAHDREDLMLFELANLDGRANWRSSVGVRGANTVECRPTSYVGERKSTTTTREQSIVEESEEGSKRPIFSRSGSEFEMEVAVDDGRSEGKRSLASTSMRERGVASVRSHV